jgi:ribonuclease HII
MNSERKDEKLRFERELWRRGVRIVAGIDEAGRGPLAGPVVAAAVIVPEGFFLEEVDDSKCLPAARREALFDLIMSGAGGVGVGVVDHEVIDRINILNATFLAMNTAVRNLPLRPEHLLVDGNRFAGTTLPFSTIVDGDALSFSIGAASIVAKVTRDRMMADFDRLYPGYGFAEHKGYGTPAHRDAISRLGPCPIHRRSFRLLKEEEEVP